MTETEQFLATIGPRITEAETALHNGDSGPRSAMWSRRAADAVRRGDIRARMGRDRADLRYARAALLGLPVVPEPDRGRRSLRRPRLHRRARAHDGVDQRRRA